MDLSWLPLEKGKWEYKSKQELPGTLLMNDISGSRILLNHLEPHKAEWSLGIQLTPDGDHAAELQFHKEQTLLWAAHILHSKAPQHITWLNFRTVLLKKVPSWLLPLPIPNAMISSTLLSMQYYHLLVSIVIMAKSNLYNSQGFLHLSALLKFWTLALIYGATSLAFLWNTPDWLTWQNSHETFFHLGCSLFFLHR